MAGSWSSADHLRSVNDNRREAELNITAWIRQGHRWLGIVLTLTILANFVAISFGEPPAPVVCAPLVPLALLLASGLYMFVLPYVGRRGSGPTA
jgi:hypothetical protein